MSGSITWPAQHRANFDLCTSNTRPRTPGATEADLAEFQRRIDSTNHCATTWLKTPWTAFFAADLHHYISKT